MLAERGCVLWSRTLFKLAVLKAPAATAQEERQARAELRQDTDDEQELSQRPKCVISPYTSNQTRLSSFPAPLLLPPSPRRRPCPTRLSSHSIPPTPHSTTSEKLFKLNLNFIDFSREILYKGKDQIA